MAATAWPTNAHMIRDAVVPLGYLKAEDHVLDPTWGRGRWWKLWRPEKLTAHDLHTLDGVDFRHLPHPDGCFDAVAFDPPYMAPGGRRTSTLVDFNDRYGTHTTAATPAAQQLVIVDGLREVLRVVRPRGVVLVKACEYVNGGRYFAGTYLTLAAAVDLGFELVDRLEHVCKNPRPQPPRTRADGQPVRQLHSRRNLSTLLVFRRPA